MLTMWVRGFMGSELRQDPAGSANDLIRRLHLLVLINSIGTECRPWGRHCSGRWESSSEQTLPRGSALPGRGISLNEREIRSSGASRYGSREGAGGTVETRGQKLGSRFPAESLCAWAGVERESWVIPRPDPGLTGGRERFTGDGQKYIRVPEDSPRLPPPPDRQKQRRSPAPRHLPTSHLIDFELVLPCPRRFFSQAASWTHSLSSLNVCSGQSSEGPSLSTGPRAVPPHLRQPPSLAASHRSLLDVMSHVYNEPDCLSTVSPIRSASH